MEMLLHDPSDMPADTAASGLTEVHQTAQDAACKEELVSSKLADLRPEMRPPGQRKGELTDAESIGHDLIVGGMQKRNGVTHLERRIRKQHAAERLADHIRKLRGEVE